MTKTQTENFIDWLKDFLLAVEEFFHQIQAWFDTGTWTNRVLGKEETTAAE